MSNYIDLELPTLLDLLVSHTSDYTAMMAAGTYSAEEISQCKQTLRELQGAIAARQGKPTDFIWEEDTVKIDPEPSTGINSNSQGRV